MPRRIRMAALAANAQGAPDFYLAFVAVTNEQYDIGNHYDLAHAHAEDEGYQYPMIASIKMTRQRSRFGTSMHS